MKKIKCLIILVLFALLANAQTIEHSIFPDENGFLFSKVTNGFTKSISFPEKLDLSNYYGIMAKVANTGDCEFRIEGWINANKWDGSGIYLEPGETKTIELFMMRPREKGLSVFLGMKGIPGGTVSFAPINPKDIREIIFKVYTDGKASFSISQIKPYGQYMSPQAMSDSKDFYPFIDKLGQYKHANWPGKVNSASDLKLAVISEDECLKSLPAPSDRDRFGGWMDGPSLKATGHFRTEKVNQRWWLIDPDGHLFWSNGITCVGFKHGETAISGRTNFFESLPDKNDSLAKFYSNTNNETLFNFFACNLSRKYGSNWKEKSIRNIVKRLKSWGFNSYGNWSDSELYLNPDNRIPYTVGVSSGEKNLRFPNVFEPTFRNSVIEVLKGLDPKVINDPFCIGFFVDNELNVSGIAEQVMSLPSGSKTKLKFLEELKTKYLSIENLNRSWKTFFTNFTQIDTITSFPEGATVDKRTFELKIMDLYYKICSEEVKNFAPNKIYFGSRLHCHYFPDDPAESDIIQIASKYCDVVCFNRYRFSPKDLILPFNIDKPTIIGEFHFGALDRGPCYAGMRTVANQVQRAEAYIGYVKEALNNSQIVGTHWFMYSDMPYTGRSDGANAQIGFVDICDNPYPEIIEAARKIGYPLYKIRYSENKDGK